MLPLPSPDRSPLTNRICPRRRCTAALLLQLLGLFSATVGNAQSLSHSDDASPVPQGMLRMRITNAWTRYNERFGTGGELSPLGAELSADPLGTAQLPRLTPLEVALRQLAGDSKMRLSLGRLTVRGGARIVTTPIALDYGVTRRLTIGVEVPIVQTRRSVQLSVNADSMATVALVPTSLRAIAATRNAAVTSAYQRDADSLQKLLTVCGASPASPGCAPVNADRTGADAARQQAAAFAAAMKTLGTTQSTVLLAPRDTSALARAITAQQLATNQRLQAYLGAGAGTTQTIFTSVSSFSYIDLQGRNGVPGLLQSAQGGGLDSIRTTERLALGDIAIGAQFLVFDAFAHDTMPVPRLQSRLAIAAAMRFATSWADSSRNLVDIPTGEGPGVEVRGAYDMIVGRLGGTVAARYVKPFGRTVQAALFGDPEAAFPYPDFGERRRTAGVLLGIDVTPRYLITETLALDAHYGFERVGAPTYDAVAATPSCTTCGAPAAGTTFDDARTVQRIGFGARYSTVDSYLAGRARLPLEASFTHLETISGDPGAPKATRDQIQLRLYYRLRR